MIKIWMNQMLTNKLFWWNLFFKEHLKKHEKTKKMISCKNYEKHFVSKNLFDSCKQSFISKLLFSI